VPFVVLSQSAIPLSVLQALSHADARRLSALPVYRDAGSLVVAMSDPQDAHRMDQVRFLTGGSAVEHGALAGPLQVSIEKAYLQDAQRTQAFLLGEDLDPSRSLGALGHLEIVTGEDLSDDALLLVQDTDEFVAPDTDAKMRQLSERPQQQTIVLVVDDDDTLRTMLVDFLNKSGYQAWQAADGRDAVELLHKGLPDAVLLDAMLPSVHGFDICRRFKNAEITRHIPVIVISAVYKGEEYKDRVRLLYGANAFIEKPLKLKHLKEVLDNCLATRPEGPSYQQLSGEIGSLLQKATAAERAGDLQAAAGYLYQTVEIAPFFPVIQHRLAHLYAQIGENYRAIAQLEQAAELEPSYPILYRLARLYEKTGFSRKARQVWGRCLLTCRDPLDAGKISEHIKKLDGSTK
jgi:CheY-like chemotaxis protein